MPQPDRAPSISLDPRVPALRVEMDSGHDTFECSVCRHFIEARAAEDRELRWAAGLLVAFLLGFIGLGAYAWIDPVVRTALAVWERVQ